MDLADIVLSHFQASLKGCSQPDTHLFYLICVGSKRLQNSVLLPAGHRKLRQGGKLKIVNAGFVFDPVSKNNIMNGTPIPGNFQIEIVVCVVTQTQEPNLTE